MVALGVKLADSPDCARAWEEKPGHLADLWDVQGVTPHENVARAMLELSDAEIRVAEHGVTPSGGASSLKSEDSNRSPLASVEFVSARCR